MDLIYELRCNPAQGHPNLVLCYIVVVLENNTTSDKNIFRSDRDKIKSSK